MMPGLFDGTKLETSKQHYERFNMYIKFQTKSGHLTDPVGEAIDLLKHTLDKAESAMKGDTPIKTGQNRQCIDNVSDYYREHHRILNSVHHRLDLGLSMLLGAQQYTTVESAAALAIKDKIEGKYDENIQNINGQYRNEMYRRAENMVPQLDGTYNVSDDSNIDLHSDLDLASSNIIAHRMQGQKQRYKINTRANTNRHLALKYDKKPNMNVKI